MGCDSIPALLDRISDSETTTELVVLNRTQPEPVQRLLENAFDGEVTVTEEHRPAIGTDTVVLVQNDEIVATSSLESIMDAFLLINSDTYRTGTKGLDETFLPDVLANLDEVGMRLRGYPETNKGKLLLIAVSRYIEATALDVGQGRLDAAFQRLSRLDDEFGTRRVYERLADTAVEIHTYGVTGGKWIEDQGIDIAAHTGEADRYRKSWFVVYSPPPPSQDRSMALLAWELRNNEWRSSWTFDPEWVASIQEHIIDRF